MIGVTSTQSPNRFSSTANGAGPTLRDPDVEHRTLNFERLFSYLRFARGIAFLEEAFRPQNWPSKRLNHAFYALYIV
jgi:hypothetical protein